MTASAFYAGTVTHARLKPVRHQLRYRVFMGLFDLDEAPGLARRVWAFGCNAAGLVSFHERDHGDGSGAPLRAQIAQALGAAGLACEGPVRALCMPRVLGYAFNPLTVYFCHDRAGVLRAIVHEVHNTWGERHLYALPAAADAEGVVRQNCAKAFRVSPFLPMDLSYAFVIAPPVETVRVAITVREGEDVVLTAAFAGARRAFTSGAILRLWLTHPALTFKVIAGIHWEALRIWLKLRRARAAAPQASTTL